MNDDDMCEETNEHPAADCYRYGCENYVREIEDHAPWGSSPGQLREWAEG